MYDSDLFSAVFCNSPFDGKMVLPVRGVFPGENFARGDALYAFAGQKGKGSLGVFPKKLLKKAYLRFSYGQQAEKRICFLYGNGFSTCFLGRKRFFTKIETIFLHCSTKSSMIINNLRG
ncbi:hypothetical protein [Angelakisella massiliensis]|uniref:hypothetical protein n=1 Tax=Angelakisella massiliensis TaxID=1871018 RepID=UPI0024B1B1B3|nr:hypothetical protein [Angelakisella massiliensis]